MSRVLLACALAALVPAAARAEPIAITVHSASGGFAQSGGVTATGSTLNLGQLNLTGGSTGTFFFNNVRGQYELSFDAILSGVNSFRVELLDPLGDGDDTLDEGGVPSYVPAGYSVSNNKDGLSFAQGSALERSAVFAGGSALVSADEMTHRGDILLFSGLTGAERARVTFGLRNRNKGRGFLFRINAMGNTSPAPEPASMVLLGTGLAGLAALRRRRRMALAEPVS